MIKFEENFDVFLHIYLNLKIKKKILNIKIKLKTIINNTYQI